MTTAYACDKCGAGFHISRTTPAALRPREGVHVTVVWTHTGCGGKFKALTRPICQRPDRHEPRLKCGYPLPCPHHTAVVEVAGRAEQ